MLSIAIDKRASKSYPLNMSNRNIKRRMPKRARWWLRLTPRKRQARIKKMVASRLARQRAAFAALEREQREGKP
jgi:hypothetical protein